MSLSFPGVKYQTFNFRYINWKNFIVIDRLDAVAMKYCCSLVARCVKFPEGQSIGNCEWFIFSSLSVIYVLYIIQFRFHWYQVVSKILKIHDIMTKWIMALRSNCFMKSLLFKFSNLLVIEQNINYGMNNIFLKQDKYLSNTLVILFMLNSVMILVSSFFWFLFNP